MRFERRIAGVVQAVQRAIVGMQKAADKVAETVGRAGQARRKAKNAPGRPEPNLQDSPKAKTISRADFEARRRDRAADVAKFEAQQAAIGAGKDLESLAAMPSAKPHWREAKKYIPLAAENALIQDLGYSPEEIDLQVKQALGGDAPV